jgi:hypothetical protein
MMKSRGRCRDMEGRLADDVDGRISAADRAALHAHLAGCADCRREREAAARIGRELASLQAEELPPFFRTRLIANLDDAGRNFQPAHRPRLHRSLRLAWGSAAVLAIALVGTVLRFQHEPSSPSLSQAPAPEAHKVDEARVAALRAGIQPVSPLDDSVVSATDVAICAALSPGLPEAHLRLLVDGRDVTALADITRDYIIFAPEEEALGDGPHLVTVELDTGRERIERSWIFYAMDGGGREPVPETRKHRTTPVHGVTPRST